MRIAGSMKAVRPPTGAVGWLRRMCAMCCSVQIKEVDRDPNSIQSQGTALLPVRLLDEPSQSRVLKIRGDFPILSRRINDRSVVYFDNACMSLRPKAVVEAINGYYLEYSGCAGREAHHFGATTTRAYASAREAVQQYIGARRSSEILFVRNTTEGINIVANILPFKPGDAVLCSDIEHNSNLLPWQILRQRKGVDHRIFHTAPDTTFDWDSFRRKLDGSVKLVAIPHTSNLSGVTFPVKDIIREAHRVGALVLIDAAQGMLYRDIDVQELDADFLAFSGHKMLGPTGSGVLYAKEALLKTLPCFLVGGETVLDTTYTDFTLGDAPDRFEAGLQDYAGAIGLAAAISYLDSIGGKAIKKQVHELNSLATEELSKTKGIKLIGPRDPGQRTGILNFCVEGMAPSDVSYLLNQGANIMTRSGRHCVHSWYNARGLSGSIRASFSFYNTPEEVEFFVWTLRDIIRLYAKAG